MEQIDAESQPALDKALAGGDRGATLKAVTGLIKFADWKLYRPFLVTAVDNKLPVIAANISSRQSLPVIWQGIARNLRDGKHLGRCVLRCDLVHDACSTRRPLR